MFFVEEANSEAFAPAGLSIIGSLHDKLVWCKTDVDQDLNRVKIYEVESGDRVGLTVGTYLAIPA